VVALDTAVRGSQNFTLIQRAGTADLEVQLRAAGVEYDARVIRALTLADVVTVDGSAGAPLQQGAAFGTLVELETSAGVEYDARAIRQLVDSGGAFDSIQISAPALASATITANAQSRANAQTAARSVAVQFSGVWVGTIVFETSVDAANWAAIKVFDVAAQAWVAQATANGVFLFPSLAGITQTRVRSTAWTSGTATINFSSAALSSINIHDPLTSADAVDVSDRAAREVGRVREWGNSDNFIIFNELTAPAANAVIASAINIPAGDYTLTLSAWAADTNAVGKRVIWVQQTSGSADKMIFGGCAAPGQGSLHIVRVAFALNDKLLARVGAAGAASSVYGAMLQAKVAG
jgi:hypothetical protein